MTQTGPGGVKRKGWRHRLETRYRRFSPHAPRLAWKSWLLATLCLISIGALFLDRPVIQWVATEPEWLRIAAGAITNAGKSGWILVSSAVLGLAAHLGRRRLGQGIRHIHALTVTHACLFIFMAVAGSGLLSNLLKRAIGRARPPHLEDLGPFSFHPFAGDYDFESFPSGHATTDGALAMTLALLFPALRVPILVLGFVLALTRTLVGAHYPSDVIGGFSFGVWFTLMTAILMARHGLLFRQEANGRLALRLRRRAKA